MYWHFCFSLWMQFKANYFLMCINMLLMEDKVSRISHHHLTVLRTTYRAHFHEQKFHLWTPCSEELSWFSLIHHHIIPNQIFEGFAHPLLVEALNNDTHPLLEYPPQCNLCFFKLSLRERCIKYRFVYFLAVTEVLSKKMTFNCWLVITCYVKEQNYFPNYNQAQYI